MKKIVLGALIGLLVAACGGSKSNPDAIVGGGTDAANTCDPATDTGCATGERCTWVRTAANATTQSGILGCVAKATAPVAAGGACAYGASGATTGFDNCDDKLACIADNTKEMATGTCQPVCDTGAADQASGGCPTNYGCALFVEVFDGMQYGVCTPSCHPLQQTRDTDKAAMCGGTASAPLECVGVPSDSTGPSVFTCSDQLSTKKQDDLAYDATIGGPYINSCGAGFVPLFEDNSTDTDAMHIICSGYCQPADTSKEKPAGLNGTAPYACTGTASHECQYWWFYEAGNSMNMFTQSEFSNGLGICFDFSKYTITDPTDPTMTKTIGYPSCAALSSTTYTYDPTNQMTAMVPDNMYFGCAALPASMMFGKGSSRMPMNPANLKLLSSHLVHQ